MEKIGQIRALGLYDEKHPFFVEGSPFFLNSTDEELLEVNQQENGQRMITQEQDIDWQKMNLLELV